MWVTTCLNLFTFASISPSPRILPQMMFGCGISDDPSYDVFLSDLVRTPITMAYKMAGGLM
jgi:hypothetical protein